MQRNWIGQEYCRDKPLVGARLWSPRALDLGLHGYIKGASPSSARAMPLQATVIEIDAEAVDGAMNAVQRSLAEGVLLGHLAPDQESV